MYEPKRLFGDGGDYGAQENVELAESGGVSRDHFPSILVPT
jgi:hypothetical protein